jgi:hypothetical protein
MPPSASRLFDIDAAFATPAGFHVFISTPATRRASDSGARQCWRQRCSALMPRAAPALIRDAPMMLICRCCLPAAMLCFYVAARRVSIFSLITDIHAAIIAPLPLFSRSIIISFSRHATLSLLDFFDDTAASFEPLMSWLTLFHYARHFHSRYADAELITIDDATSFRRRRHRTITAAALLYAAAFRRGQCRSAEMLLFFL